MTSIAAETPPTCSWIALNIVPTGAVRVASGHEQHLATAELLLRHRLGHDLDRLLIGEQSALGYF